MDNLLASLIFFTALANAALSNARADRLAIWIPNPCDTFGQLPVILQPMFGDYNDVHDLNSIAAYDRYTITYITPTTAAMGWGWNTQGETPTLTSLYNSATCSSYYPPPTTAIPPTTGMITTEKVTTSATDTGRHELISTDKYAYAVVSASNSHDFVQTRTTIATTTFETITITTADAKSAPTETTPECYQRPDIAEDFHVEPSWIDQSIHEVCLILRNDQAAITPGNHWFPGNTWTDIKNGIQLFFEIINRSGYSSVIPVGLSDKALDACEANFKVAWHNCNNGGKGGHFVLDNLEWDVQPRKVARWTRSAQ